MLQTCRRSARALLDWLQRFPLLLPFLILLVGAAFRFYNLNWDAGYQLHPDERGIYMLVTGANGHPPLAWPTSLAQFFNASASPLNPHYFAYGSLPYYVLAGLAGAAAFLGAHIPFLSSWTTFDTYYGMPSIGRPLSAALDVSALAVLFLLARRLFDYWTAVLSLTLGAFTVLDIQISHFYQVDSLLLPLALTVLLASAVIAQTNERRAYVWGGLALGAALASKTTALLLVIPIGLAAVLEAWDSSPWPRRGHPAGTGLRDRLGPEDGGHPQAVTLQAHDTSDGGGSPFSGDPAQGHGGHRQGVTLRDQATAANQSQGMTPQGLDVSGDRLHGTLRARGGLGAISTFFGRASADTRTSDRQGRAQGAELLEQVRAHYAAVGPQLNSNLMWLFASYVLGALAFAVCDPYAILDRAQLISDIQAQQTFLVTNNPPFVVPFTIQYANTVPYLYQLKNLLFWCFGIPLGLAALAGTLFFLVRNAAFRFRRDQVVVLVWIVAYFLFVGRFFAKFNRYLLPINPFLILFGSAFLVWLIQRRDSRVRFASWAALCAVVLGSFLYSLAYMNIYEHANTRVAASHWIFDHIPAGATIAVEGPWDDPLPLDIPGRSGAQYRHMNLDMYALPDDQHKIDSIAQVLTRAQYIIMSSERMDRSIPRLPDRYPVSTRYYQLLLADRLNFHLIEHFQQHPQLGPFIVHDYSADESFHVYDHPDVRIYKRVAEISPARVTALLIGGAAPAARAVTPKPDSRLMLNGRQWAADQRGPTLNQMFPPAGFAMQHPLLVWFLFLEFLGLVTFPLTFLLFSSLVDRGFVIAKTVGLLALGYVVWVGVRTGIATYETGWLWLCVLVLTCASTITAWRHRRELESCIRSGWRSMAAGEAMFLAGFMLFVLLRMWYPDLGHQFSPVAPGNIGAGRMGEKQMELAFLNAIARSRVFPPYDPFFAHGYINYYYYGFFLVATLCKLTQIVPATGFNLAVATFFGLLVGNVFSVVLTLTRRAAPALVGAAFVGLIGNLNGAWQLIRDLMSVSTVHSSVPVLGGLADTINGLWQAVVAHQPLPPFDYWESTRIVPPVGLPITEFPYFTYLFADLHPHLIAYPMTVAVVALAVNYVAGGREWSSTSLLRLVLGAILLGAIAVTNPWDFPTYLLVLIIGALVGAFSAARGVSFRLLAGVGARVGAMTALAVVLYAPFKLDYQTVFSTGIGLVRDVTAQQLTGNGVCNGQASCQAAIHDALQTPLRIYLEHFGLFVFVILSYLAFLLTTRAGIGARLQRASTFMQFAWYYRDRLTRVRRAGAAARRMRTHRQEASVDWSIVAGFAILCLGLLLMQDFLLGFMVAMTGLVVVTAQRLARGLSASELFVLVVLLVPLLLSIGTQVFFIKDWLSQGAAFRMNTIFKFYNQIWVLYAICSAVALDRLYTGRRERRESNAGLVEKGRDDVETRSLVPSASSIYAFAATGPPGPRPEQREANEQVRAFEAGAIPVETRAPASLRQRFPVPRAGSSLSPWPAWSAGLALLVLGSLVYTFAGTVSRETYRATWIPENSVPLTLDGMAFMKVAYPGEYRAISWLNANAAGAQVIAEATNPWYDWRSRVSMFTGLPSIVNGMHENVEQRYSDELDPSALCSALSGPCPTTLHPRADDVTTLYSSQSITDAWRVIRTYGVRYIYVGFSERQCAQGQCFPHVGLSKFNRMVGHGLRRAYSSGGVTIYEVVKA